MATTIYLVRHGETDHNRHRIMQGRGVDAALNATGRRQAQAVAERFADAPVDAIYSSSLRRAVETAQVARAYHPDVPFRQDSDLDEMGWGVLEDTSPSPERDRALAAIYERWKEGDYAACVEDGESILDVQGRGVRAVEQIVADHPGETVLVITHGRMLRVLLASLLDDYDLSQMHELDHSNTGVNCLVHREGGFEPQRLNCTVHLNGGVPGAVS